MARSFFTPIMVLFTIAFTAVVCMDRLCHMHAEYMKQVSKLEQDLKMLVICRNETHKSVLSTYTPVCLELESNARIGAFMLALTPSREATTSRVPLPSSCTPCAPSAGRSS